MAVTNEYTLKVNVKDALANIEELNKSLDAQEGLVQELTDSVSDYERELDKMNKKDYNRIKQTKELIATTKKQLAEEKAGIKQIKNERIKANKVLKEAEENQADFGGVLGYVDKQLGGAISGFTKMTKTIGSATKGMKLLKIAIIGTGIGALLIALTSLAAAFTRSEKGQEKLQIAMAAMGAVVNQVLDLYADLGELIIKAFTKPQEVFKSFADSFKKFISNPIETVKGAFKNAKEAATDFIDETRKEIKASTDITKSRQKAHHIERELQVERANADRDINELRLKAEDREKNSASDRIAILKKAQKIEDEITAKEIKAKKLLLDAALKEDELGKSTIEDLDAIAKLEADLIKLDTKRLRSKRLLQTQITTAKNEEKAENEAAIKAEQDAIDSAAKLEIEKAKELADLKKQIRDQEAVSEDQQRALQLTKIDEHYNALIAKAEENGLNTSALIIAREQALLKTRNQFREKDAADDKKIEDQKLNYKQQVQAATANLLGSFGSVLQQIAGENKKVAIAGVIAEQAASVAQIISNTGIANAKAVAALPLTGGMPFVAINTISAGLGITKSVLGARKAIQDIKSAGSTSSASGNASGLPRAAAASSSPQAPAFNIVGASSTNQLADAISSQTNQPVQAFVVAGDVTTAQSLERNVITGATIG